MSSAQEVLRENIIEITKERDHHLYWMRFYEGFLAGLKAAEAPQPQTNDGTAGERGQEDSVQPKAQKSEFRQGGSEEYSDNVSGRAAVQPVGLQTTGQSGYHLLRGSESLSKDEPCPCELSHAQCDAPMAQHGPESTASFEAATHCDREDKRRGSSKARCTCYFCWAGNQSILA